MKLIQEHMTEGTINILTLVSFAILLISLLLAFIRLVKGPTVNDRIAAMDLISSIVIGFILVYSMFVKNAMYIDTAIVIALISFVSTVAISTYLKQKNS